VSSYVSPGFRISEAKFYGNAQPAFDRPIAVLGRIKKPAPDCFSGGAIQNVAAGAAVDFDLL
jgi:hypothetical protein